MTKKCDTYAPIISKEIYEKELEMCRQLHREGKCCWGDCKNCGVIALLYKLHTGDIIYGKDLSKLKEKVFRDARE